MTFKPAIALALALSLGACETTSPDVTLSPAEAAALKTTWLGKRWDGVWGKTCEGSVEVLSLEGNVGRVRYAWGSNCGSAGVGDFIDDNTTFTPTEMHVTLTFGRRADYVLQADGSLAGRYTSRQGADSRGTFRQVSG